MTTQTYLITGPLHFAQALLVFVLLFVLRICGVLLFILVVTENTHEGR